MLVSPQEYLGLTDQLELLSTKTKALQADNKRLNETVLQQQETISVLNQRLTQEINKNKSMQEEIIRHIDQNSLNVEQAVAAATQEQMRFFEAELMKIKDDANVQKIRQLEKKMTENRFNNHEMVDFYQKIQSLYMVLNNTKVAPPMADLYKWATLRKNDQLNTSLGVSQRNVMGGSKVSITKNYNAPSMNASKINYNNNMNSSKIGGSRMGLSKINNNAGQNRNQRRVSKGKNQLPPSQFKNGKQNSSPARKPPLSANNNKKNKQNFEVLSTQSVTQAINVENLSFENPSDKLISIQNKQSVFHVDIQ